MKGTKSTTKFEVRATVDGNLSMIRTTKDTKEEAVEIAKRLCKEESHTYYVKRIDTRVVHISMRKRKD